MSTTPINPRELAAPRGYSHGMLSRRAACSRIAGQIGWDANAKLVSTEFVPQFGRALANVVAVLARRRRACRAI